MHLKKPPFLLCSRVFLTLAILCLSLLPILILVLGLQKLSLVFVFNAGSWTG